MLRLADVTLVAVDCAQPAAALLALERCTAVCRFGEVLLATDAPIDAGRVRTVPIAPLRSRAEYSEFIIRRLGAVVGSSHALLVQWDGFILDPAAWNDAFLEWDYIGAPWGYGDGMDVGNGGFSLRSRRLMDAGKDPEIKECEPEDERICRTYRPYLEARYGIRFAPLELARRFSVEHVESAYPTFGFHGAFNLWRALDGAGIGRLIHALPPAAFARQDMLALAYRCWEQRRHQDAEELLMHIVTLNPDHSGAALMLAEMRADPRRVSVE
jgi:hypothetical protein